MNKERALTLSLIIFAAAASRLLPHPANVAPIAAIALFSGAQFERKWLAFIVPLAALLISDAIIGFYPQMYVTYAAFALVTCIGFALQGRQRPLPIAVATLSGSLLFFLVTNFALWSGYDLYPHTLAGVTEGYFAALPFFQHTLLGDAFYAVLLFGGFALAERKYPRLRPLTA
jgi:hypothetical protein